MTREWLGAQLGMLSSLRGMPDEHGIGGYFDALRDIPQDVLRKALQHALRTRSFFPTPVELRTDADAVVSRQRAQVAETVYVPREPDPDGFTARIRNPFTGAILEIQVDRAWHDECDECRDTGKALAYCGEEASARAPWVSVRRCHRRDEHYEHEWAYDCPCAGTNQTIKRRKEAQARYAQTAEKGR